MHQLGEKKPYQGIQESIYQSAYAESGADVVFLSRWVWNPYETLLSRALNKMGWRTRSVMARMIFVFDIVKAPTKVVHIQNLENHFPSESLLKSWLEILAFLVQLIVLKLLRKRIIWTFHDLFNHRGLHLRSDKIGRQLATLLFDEVIVHSNFALDCLKKERLYSLNAKKFSVIPLGSYVGYYEPVASKEEARAKLGIAKDAFVYLLLGAIRKNKRPDLLVSAFHQIAHGPMTLVLAGRLETEILGRQLDSQVAGDPRIITCFQGIPEDEVGLYLKAADVFVLPFERVLTSASLILAFSWGLPVICGRFGNFIEVADSRGAFFYDEMSEDALAETMRKAWLQRAQLEEMGTYNLDKMAAYSWDELVKKFISAYNGTRG